MQGAWRSAFEIDAQNLLDRIRDSTVSADSFLPAGTHLPYEPTPAFGAVMVLGFVVTVMFMISYSSVYRKIWLNSWYRIHGALSAAKPHTSLPA